MINAKQLHEQKQKPATKVAEKRSNKPQACETYDTNRISSAPETTSCAGSLELHAGPLCRLWKATGYSVNGAECGTVKNVLQQVAGRCLLVENVTDPNSHSTDPNSPAILQKVAICRALEN
jgi:hypothetical protein